MEYNKNRATASESIARRYPQLSNKNDNFYYQFFHRLASDCEYWLTYGNRCDKHLWANDWHGQIWLMQMVLAMLPVDWIDPGMLSDMDRYQQILTVN